MLAIFSSTALTAIRYHRIHQCQSGVWCPRSGFQNRLAGLIHSTSHLPLPLLQLTLQISDFELDIFDLIADGRVDSRTKPSGPNLELAQTAPLLADLGTYCLDVFARLAPVRVGLVAEICYEPIVEHLPGNSVVSCFIPRR